MTTYYVSHIGGLEDIVADELREKLPGVVLLPGEYGRQHLQYAGDPAQLLTVRTIENAYVRVLELPARPERAWLDDLEIALAGADLRPALDVLRRLRSIPPHPSFRASAERVGEQEYRSPEVAGFAGAGVVTATGWRVDLRGFDVEVRVDVRHDKALVGVRLTKQALHKRSRVVHPRVTINPTIAAAMVRLSRPQPGEVVCDPMLGGGTLLTERYAYAPDAWLLGGDLHAEKLALAQQNFAALGVPAQLVQWDLRCLPLRDQTLDKVICNPPWGNLIADRRFNRKTYPQFLSHLRRCLRLGGLMVLLTSERRLVQQFVDRHQDIQLLLTQRLNVGGLHPSLHVLQRALPSSDCSSH